MASPCEILLRNVKSVLRTGLCRDGTPSLFICLSPQSSLSLRQPLKTHHRWVLPPLGSGRIASQFPIEHQGEPCGGKSPTFTSAFGKGNSFCHMLKSGMQSIPSTTCLKGRFHIAQQYFTWLRHISLAQSANFTAEGNRRRRFSSLDRAGKTGLY